VKAPAGDGGELLRAMDPEERRAFCREVMERLSELVEGEAPADFCARVEAILGDCRPFHALRQTLETTIRLTREIGAAEPGTGGDEAFRRAVERVRRTLEGGRAGRPGA
jgi:hypothetical protein